eukprot:GHVL01038188.1.p3 GENE.GHVL01038188.1~~GHVL01038188.1.p3  ORF type:complete len:122 (-),score=8.14 GHVL01038188.1:260-625(-)
MKSIVLGLEGGKCQIAFHFPLSPGGTESLAVKLRKPCLTVVRDVAQFVPFPRRQESGFRWFPIAFLRDRKLALFQMVTVSSEQSFTSDRCSRVTDVIDCQSCGQLKQETSSVGYLLLHLSV